MPSLQIILDTREARLHDHLAAQLAAAHPTAELVVAPLDVADVQIVHHDPDFRLLIERKSERDLGASLKDGRYREQKARMLATVPPHHCLYLIENAHRPTWGAVACSACSDSAYAGAILHTMFRDGMHVVITEGIADTAAWIVALYGKCVQNPDKFAMGEGARAAGTDGSATYLAHAKIKTKKMDNVCPRTCFRMMLGQIPGVSERLGRAIADVYPNWRALVRLMDEHEENECVRALCKIPLIGPKKARTILEYIRNSCEDTSKEGDNGAVAP
jgi:ERCC4-type nuclease